MVPAGPTEQRSGAQRTGAEQGQGKDRRRGPWPPGAPCEGSRVHGKRVLVFSDLCRGLWSVVWK